MVENPMVLPTVFLAEDDDDDFFIFSLAAQETPIKIALNRAKDGAALMQMLEQSIPDFLFLDLLMPGKNGIQCLKEIRGNRRYDGMCVIVYSSLNNLYHAQLCYQENANAFIEKPSSVDTLKKLFQMVFSMDWTAGKPEWSLNEFVIRQQ